MKVLLATDGSKNAEAAAWLLSRLPHSKTLGLTVLSVNQMREMHGTVEVVEWMQRNLDAEKGKAAEACQRIEQMFQGADARVESVIAEGHPGKSIIEEAHKRGIELIVIGAVGRGMLDRLLLGSVSDFVATHAQCSVLVVRPDKLQELQQRSLNVCIAYDDSPQCKETIKRLSEFEWSRNTNMDLISVIGLPYSYSEIPIEIDTEAIKAATLETLEQATKDLREISPAVTCHVIESIHVGDGIVRFAGEKHCDLIVMGDTGRGLLGRFLVGSTSRYVLRHAHCCVWIGRSTTKK